MRILMVCLGNICRSPIAEGLLQDKIKKHGLDWIVDSAGTESYHIGEAPHLFSQKVCLAHHIDISGQRARKFVPQDFLLFDKIYAMAGDVFREIKEIGRPESYNENGMDKVDFFLNELNPGSNANVPDPWYGPEEGFWSVYDLIDKTCNAIIEKYR